MSRHVRLALLMMALGPGAPRVQPSVEVIRPEAPRFEASEVEEARAGVPRFEISGVERTGPAVSPAEVLDLEPGARSSLAETPAPMRLQRSAAERDTITYRQLRLDDFRAPQPPPELAGHGERLGAAVCVFLSPDPDMQVRAAASWRDGEQPIYRTRAENVRYRALLDRECSWWSRGARLSPEYRLAHEQVHFAFFEIAARRMTERLAQRIPELDTAAHTAEASLAVVNEVVEEELDRAIEEVAERSGELDRDTSGQRRPDLLRRWLRRIEEELRETSPGD